MHRIAWRPLTAALILSLVVLVAGVVNAPAPAVAPAAAAPAVAAPTLLVCPTGYTPQTLRVLTYRNGGYVDYLDLIDRRDEAEEALRTPLTDRQRRVWERRLATANRLLLDAVLVNTSTPPSEIVRVCAR